MPQKHCEQQLQVSLTLTKLFDDFIWNINKVQTDIIVAECFVYLLLC